MQIGVNVSKKNLAKKYAKKNKMRRLSVISLHHNSSNNKITTARMTKDISYSTYIDNKPYAKKK